MDLATNVGFQALADAYGVFVASAESDLFQASSLYWFGFFVEILVRAISKFTSGSIENMGTDLWAALKPMLYSMYI